jgi:hypothetical protein
MMASNMRAAFVSVAVLAASLQISPARAQSASDKAAAEALFDQGRAAMQEGDFGKACGLLERSQHIDPGIGTLLYLAECYEKGGRTASAWATFREAADAAEAVKKSDRARTGRERAARLEPLLSRLTIQVSPEAQQIPGLTIERGGRPIQQALWNVPVPVDPADYQVTASAVGYEPWSQSVTVPEKAARASITVPVLKKGADDRTAAGPPHPTDAAPSSGASPSPMSSMPAPPGAEPTGSKQRAAAYIVGGVGLLAIGMGTYFGLSAISKNNEAKDDCPGRECNTPRGPEAADEAGSAARLANITFAIGGAALVGGAVLFFTSPRGTEGTTVRAAVGPTGLTVAGSFQ